MSTSTAKLNSLSSRLLSSILELSRAKNLNLPISPSTIPTILKNLSTLQIGITQITNSIEQIELQSKETKIYNLLLELKLVEPRQIVGNLIDVEEDLNAPLIPELTPPPHTTITFPEPSIIEPESSNSQLYEMQTRMLDDQDETLDTLSSVISRQHLLSLSISTELESHETLLDGLDQGIDSTQNRLRRAGNQLERIGKKAVGTGSTGLIVLLVFILVVLVTVFKN